MGVHLDLTACCFVDRYDLVASASAAFVGKEADERVQHSASGLSQVRVRVE